LALLFVFDSLVYAIYQRKATAKAVANNTTNNTNYNYYAANYNNYNEYYNYNNPAYAASYNNYDYNAVATENGEADEQQLQQQLQQQEQQQVNEIEQDTAEDTPQGMLSGKGERKLVSNLQSLQLKMRKSKRMNIRHQHKQIYENLHQLLSLPMVEITLGILCFPSLTLHFPTLYTSLFLDTGTDLGNGLLLLAELLVMMKMRMTRKMITVV
jgi:hypothetical protein